MDDECGFCFGTLRNEPYWPEYLDSDDELPTRIIVSCTKGCTSFSRELTEAEYTYWLDKIVEHQLTYFFENQAAQAEEDARVNTAIENEARHGN